MNTINPANSFDNLGIAPKLLDILAKHKFIQPTPIQSQAIPSVIEGKDLMGIAQTGTGKTLAFGIPMIQRLAQSAGKSRGLIVLPTRELALQVNESLKKIGGSLGLKTAILIGGEPIGRQTRVLRQNPHIYIATPGRLIDHLEHKTINLRDVHILVLDEADRMLDMGFAPQLKKILQAVPSDRQTLLFSATMPEAIVSIANSYMKTPLRIEVAPAGSAVKSVTQEIFFVDRNQKLPLLKTVLNQYKGSVLVFSRTKFGAKKIALAIRQMGETSTEIHSNKSLNQRIEALNGFKLGKYRVMVATDIAARGIDVSGIQLVVNYDLPENAEDYVHRIGRTGRASSTGHAISFATHDQRRDINTIERLIRKTLPVSKHQLGNTTESLPAVSSDTFSRSHSSPRSHRPARSHSSSRPHSPARSNGKPLERSGSRPPRPGFDHKRRDSAPAGKSSNKRKWSDYERGRKAPPQSLKKISQASEGFYLKRKTYSDDD